MHALEFFPSSNFQLKILISFKHDENPEIFLIILINYILKTLFYTNSKFGLLIKHIMLFNIYH